MRPTPGATATATKTLLPKAGEYRSALRVTDNGGDHGDGDARRRRPEPSPDGLASRATPNPVPTGAPVTFDASGSTDPDGTIAKYEWDLDGNGSYETSTGATATTSQLLRERAANHTVGVRVTDDDGATATDEPRSGHGPEPAPTASFTVTPNPAATGTAVTFNASASTDPDGTIAKYEWDLDGNGTYETSTGATPTTSKTYTSAATPTVGLRVTDNSGATATTTRAAHRPQRLQRRRPRDLGPDRLLAPRRDLRHRPRRRRRRPHRDRAERRHPRRRRGPRDRPGQIGHLRRLATTPRRPRSTSPAPAPVTVEFWLKWASFANNDDARLRVHPELHAQRRQLLHRTELLRTERPLRRRHRRPARTQHLLLQPALGERLAPLRHRLRHQSAPAPRR